MNAISLLTLGLAAGMALTGTVQAQAPAAPAGAKMGVIVQFGKARPQQLMLEKAVGKNEYEFIDKQQATTMKGKVSSSTFFMLQTPADANAVIRRYYSGDLKSARPALGAVKKKYAAFIGLPGNVGEQAALFEIIAAIRQGDWAAAKELCASFPQKAWIADNSKRDLEVLTITADAPADAAAAKAQVESISALLKDKAAMDKLPIELYGFLQYAYGRALVGQLPAGPLNEAQAKIASEAADAFCQAAMAQRGKNPEFIRMSMQQAAKALWLMPGVAEYAKKLGKRPSMTKENWKAGPLNFREATQLLNVADSLYPVEEEKDEAIVDMKRYFFDIKAAK